MYFARDLQGIAGTYHNLGNYLRILARQPAPALVGHLAAALSFSLIGVEGSEGSVRAAAADLRALGPDAAPPADIAELAGQLGDIPGTDLPHLIATLVPKRETAEQTLRQLIEQAQAEAAAPLAPNGHAIPVVTWRPVIFRRLPM